MSRQRRGLQLPHALQKELGLERSNNRRKNGVQNRKEQRKADHIEKRQHIRGSKSVSTVPKHHRQPSDDEPDVHDEDDHSDQSEAEPVVARRTVEEVKPNPIMKKTVLPPPSEDSTDSEAEGEEGYERLYRGDSPEIVLDASSRSYKDKQAEEDDDIAALEKRLGLKGKKKGGIDDGLSDLLGETDTDATNRTKRKRDEDDWLKSKRRKAEVANQSPMQAVNGGPESEGDSALEGPESGPDDVDDELEDSEGDPDIDEEDSDSFAGFDSNDNESADEQPPPRVRENPYVPPVAAPSAAKYIPPSLRKAQGSEDEALSRLRRQLQGHLNKLSEANLISILASVEAIYRTNPRGSVTETLVELLLSLFSSPTTLSNTFCILHGAFAAAVYRVVGVDFGASLLSALVDRFLSYHTADATTKEPLNLVSLLSNLFTFNVIASPLIYSYIRILLTPLTESNAELLLRLIRDCGPQLRIDDPGALKTIVILTQKAAAELEAKDGKISVRTKFMLETLTDLKNNKLRASTIDVGTTKEHITRMRKALGSLSNRNLRATEPLRIDLDDIRNSDRKGKWWLVGASWKGHDGAASGPSNSTSVATAADGSQNDEEDIVPADAVATEPDYTALARQLRLTTPLAISIFTAIASSPGAIEAHERLLKLNLKNAQITEIPRVVLRCCAAEPTYNPFYDVVAKRLCTLGDKAKRIAKGFEFACWGFLRRIGASTDEDEDAQDGEDTAAEDVEMHEVNNVARMYAALIHGGCVSLGVLKVVDLHTLKGDSMGQLWVELLVVQVLVLCKGEEGPVRRVFARLEGARQVVPRLRVFGRQWVKGSRLVEKEERRAVKKGWTVAERVLEELGRGK